MVFRYFFGGAGESGNIITKWFLIRDLSEVVKQSQCFQVAEQRFSIIVEDTGKQLRKFLQEARRGFFNSSRGCFRLFKGAQVSIMFLKSTFW